MELVKKEKKPQRECDIRAKKKWLEKNRDRYLKMLNRWYDENRENVKIKKTCDICGNLYQPINVYHHKKTRAHQNALKTLENPEV